MALRSKIYKLWQKSSVDHTICRTSKAITIPLHQAWCYQIPTSKNSCHKSKYDNSIPCIHFPKQHQYTAFSNNRDHKRQAKPSFSKGAIITAWQSSRVASEWASENSQKTTDCSTPYGSDKSASQQPDLEVRQAIQKVNESKHYLNTATSVFLISISLAGL